MKAPSYRTDATLPLYSACLRSSREGGQKKLVKNVPPWLPYMGVAQTNLPIEAMLKFEFVSIMIPSNTGLGSMFW